MKIILWIYNHTFSFDHIVSEHANITPDFFFIQIGVADGKSGDPIYKHVLKYKWSGILIEPVRHLFDKLVKTYAGQDNLTFENIAMSDKNGFRDFYRLKEDDKLKDWQGQLGSFSKKHVLKHREDIPETAIEKYLTTENVRCITLGELLKKYNVKKIDLLQIDAEGYDYEIIKQLDFDSIKPKIINYEHKHLDKSNRKKCKLLLKKNGYTIFEFFPDTVAFLNLNPPLIKHIYAARLGYTLIRVLFKLHILI